MRAAAAITSITMKGGTSLRAEGDSSALTRSLSVDSSIDICYFHRRVPEFRFPNRLAPQTGRIRWLVIAFCSEVIPVGINKSVETTDCDLILI
jgi:hypothetical protein